MYLQFQLWQFNEYEKILKLDSPTTEVPIYALVKISSR